MTITDINRINQNEIEIHFDKDIDLQSRDKINILARELANNGYLVNVFIKQEELKNGMADYFYTQYNS